MIIDPSPQGSTEWLKARLGVPTSSQFHRLVTPKTLKPSAQAEGYAMELLAEWLIGEPLDDHKTGFMERGNDIEPEARSWYEFDRDVDVRQVGLCLRDDRLVGFSPDGLVGDDGGLEIKVPSAAKHVAYLCNPQSLVDDYRCQHQGSLMLSGRSWWDIVSYNPVMPQVVVRVERDHECIMALCDAVDALLARLASEKAKLTARGVKPATPRPQYVEGQQCTAVDGGLSCGMVGVAETPDGWRCEEHRPQDAREGA